MKTGAPDRPAITDFGLHRIGLAALRAPKTSWLALLVVAIVAAIGASRITIDTSLTKLFHGGSEEFAKYQRLLDVLPASEYDVHVMIKGDRLFTPEKLRAIRDLHLDLRVLELVRSTVSIFSARRAITGPGEPDAVIPEELPGAQDLAALEQTLLQHPMVKGRLLSPQTEDGQVMLIVASLDPSPDLQPQRDEALAQIKSLSKQYLAPLGLTFAVGGAPIARDEMLRGVRHDFIVFNSTGFIVGVLICALFFRSLRFVLIAGLCPAAGALITTGLIGLAGVKLNPLLNAIPLLVMAVTFTDVMHLLYAIKENIRAGRTVEDAAAVAIRDVGPACFIASITTSAALLSMLLSSSALLRSFGFWAALTSFASVLNLMVLLPLLARATINRDAVLHAPASDAVGSVLPSSFYQSLTDWVARWALRIVQISVVATAVLAVAYMNLDAKYRLVDQLPSNGAFHAVNEEIDKSLAGPNQVIVLMRWDANAKLSHGRIAAAVRGVHDAAGATGSQPVISILTVVPRDPADRAAGDAELLQRLAELRANAFTRLLDERTGAAIVTIQLHDRGARYIANFANDLDEHLWKVRRANPEITFTVTGMSALLSRETPRIVNWLNRALIGAFALVFLIIGVAFRSTKIALISIIPNVLPVLAAGALAYLVMGGLDYASIVGLTIAFGLAVDDTVHFLNRIMREVHSGEPIAAAAGRALTMVGPVLVFTTLVLMCGLAVTAFSEMPPTRTLGQTCVVTLLAALIADLIVLPALVVCFGERIKLLPQGTVREG